MDYAGKGNEGKNTLLYNARERMRARRRKVGNGRERKNIHYHLSPASINVSIYFNKEIILIAMRRNSHRNENDFSP